MIFRIIVRSFLLVVFFISSSSFGMNQEQVAVADSLFAEEKYTEAMGRYRSFFEGGYASPAMLLKMAYVADATGNFADALFYLDLYYQKSGDRLVIGKIEEMANERGLYGYIYSDLDYLFAIFSKFRVPIFSLILVSLLFLLVYIYRKLRRAERPTAAMVLQVFFSLILLLLVNFEIDQKAIVVSDQALLRAGPSAGAEPIRIISKGHKVTVLANEEVWSKILWEGDEVFVRTSRLRSI